MSESLFISVIIPTYHRNDLLALCLDQLAPGKQTLSTSCYEVIVTDDGISQTAQAMIQNQYSWARWVEGPRKGPAANRNQGERSAKGNWLVFLDDDCLPDFNCLEAYYVAINHDTTIKAIEGRIYVTEPRTRLDQISPINETGNNFWSCNIAIEKDFFYVTGKFDERFPFANMEDTDLRKRIYDSKAKNLFLYAAAVHHPWRYYGGWKKLMQSEKSIFIYLDIHPEENKKINSLFFLKKVIRSFLYYTIPYSFKLKFKGIGAPFLEHIAELRLMILLFKNK